MCDEIESDLETTVDKTIMKVMQKVQQTAEAIEGDVDNFQGERSKIPLFKEYPCLGEKAEFRLKEAKEKVTEVRNLTASARQQAMKLYGQDFVLPSGTSSV